MPLSTEHRAKLSDKAREHWASLTPEQRRERTAAATTNRLVLPASARAIIADLVDNWPEFSAEKRAELTRLLAGA